MSGQSQSHLAKHQALSNLVLQTHFPKHLRSRTTCTEAIILVLGVHGQRKIAGNIFLKMTGNMIGSLHSPACCRFAYPHPPPVAPISMLKLRGPLRNLTRPPHIPWTQSVNIEMGGPGGTAICNMQVTQPANFAWNLFFPLFSPGYGGVRGSVGPPNGPKEFNLDFDPV